jgi:SAM-dependent methyltransferase
MKRQLLLGCGNSREKRMGVDNDEGWGDLVTLDIDPSTGCDVVHDLDALPYPFRDAEFDEIYAFEVLEHCGRQGDWRFFFAQFSELHRVLKPGGYIFLSVPSMDSPWLWGDPGHTRALPVGAFNFLAQKHYAQVGTTSCTDYRPWWRGDLEIAGSQDGDGSLRIALVKPLETA